MSKELVARALRELAVDNEESTPIQRAIDDSTAALIRAVDGQCPKGYDAQDGYVLLRVNGPSCADCFHNQTEGHAHDCLSWNARVALLNLCRDITGEKE